MQNALGASAFQSSKHSVYRDSLVSRFADFWLLGGLSLFAFYFIVSDRIPFFYIILAAPFFQVFVEYPHLIASYKLAYSRDWIWIRKHALRLIVWPCLMGLIALGALLGPELFPIWFWKVAVSAIFIGFGWHRARQVFGCLLLYSRFDGYTLSRGDRQTLEWLTHAIWIDSYINVMTISRPLRIYDFEVPRIFFPEPVVFAANVFLMVGLLGFLFILLKKAYLLKSYPSINFLIPLVAFLVWSNSYVFSLDYYFLLTPTFHSLQHLACVAGYRTKGFSLVRVGTLFVFCTGIGYVLMRSVPSQLVYSAGHPVLAMYIFISLHHYLLDSVIWKTSDPETAERLLLRTVS